MLLLVSCSEANLLTWLFCLQLILPECMKLLPLYTNCISKNDILLGGECVICLDNCVWLSEVIWLVKLLELSGLF